MNARAAHDRRATREGEGTVTGKNKPDDAGPIGRRNVLLGAGTAVAAGLAPATAAESQTAQSAVAAAPADPEPLLTLTAAEHAFFVAAADTIIPADELSPSGSECGV